MTAMREWVIKRYASELRQHVTTGRLCQAAIDYATLPTHENELRLMVTAARFGNVVRSIDKGPKP